MKQVVFVIIVFSVLGLGVVSAGHDGCHQRHGWESHDNGQCNSNHINDSLNDTEPNITFQGGFDFKPALIGVDGNLHIQGNQNVTTRYAKNDTRKYFNPFNEEVSGLLSTDRALWVSSSDKLYKIDKQSGVVLDSIDINIVKNLGLVGTHHIVFSKDNKTYVVNEKNANIINTTTMDSQKSVQSIAVVGKDVYISTPGNLTKWSPENNTTEWTAEWNTPFIKQRTEIQSNGDLIVAPARNGIHIFYPNGTKKGNISVSGWRQSSITDKYIVGGHNGNSSWDVYSLDNQSLVASHPAADVPSGATVVGDDRVILTGASGADIHYSSFPGLDTKWNKSVSRNIVGDLPAFVYKEKLILVASQDSGYYTTDTFNRSAQSDTRSSYASISTATPIPTPTPTPSPTPTSTASPTPDGVNTSAPAGNVSGGLSQIYLIGGGIVGLGVVVFMILDREDVDWI